MITSSEANSVNAPYMHNATFAC